MYWHSDDSSAHQPFHVTVSFNEQNEQTNLVMRLLFHTEAERVQMVDEFNAIEGLNSTLDCLAEHLKTRAS